MPANRKTQWSSELSSQLLVMVPDSDNPVHKDVSSLRAEIGRQKDILRSHEAPSDLSQPGRPPFASSHSFDPVSPRQQAFDASRRPSLQPASRTTSFRTPMPPHLIASPRRYGSMSGPSGPNGSSSPSSVRPPPPPPPPPTYTLPPPPSGPSSQTQHQPPQVQQQLLSVEASPPMSLSRRHTSADIRLQGWQGQPGGPPPPMPSGGNHGGSPYASGQNSSHWPSSPYRQAANAEDQQLRNALAQYELPRGNSHTSRQVTPPPDHGVPSYGNPSNEGWQLPGPKFPFKGIEASAPPTRRSSMASNVHSLLNPPDMSERDGEDEGGPEERKRKRIS